MATLKPPQNISEDLLAAMNVTREYLDNRGTEKAALDAAAPSVGSLAPDFTAPLLSEDGAVLDATVQLSGLRDKPVGLLFGSYTCPIFRGQLGRYEEIHQQLKAVANFLCVYILEAHPEDGWRVPHNWEQGICFATPQSLGERAGIARLCFAEHGFSVPTVMDSMDNRLLELYAGSPERLYVIDTDGIIRHRSSIGPFDADDVEAWFQVLQEFAGVDP